VANPFKRANRYKNFIVRLLNKYQYKKGGGKLKIIKKFIEVD
jgi:hypothetical protein